jgi:Zn-dependent protease
LAAGGFCYGLRRMNMDLVMQGLAQYLCVVVIITVHEFGHAWMASRCGDDTARSLGRVSLNPVVHMDLIGTVLLPLLVIFLTASGQGRIAGFIIGWGKPVPVNYLNLRQVNRDSVLVAMAGPAMNVVLTLVVLGVARFGLLVSPAGLPEAVLRSVHMMAVISMFLCFFNLLPIPPLDGSHVMRLLTGMSHETFFAISRFGFFIVILIVQIPQVNLLLAWATEGSLRLFLGAMRFP